MSDHVLSKGIGGHHRAYRGLSCEWFTPPEILHALGHFDLDPCAGPQQANSGLLIPWEGRIYLNPPYGPDCIHWMRRLAQHGNGIAIIFARTETKMFFECVWEAASAVLFIRGRINFYKPDGTPGARNAGGPSVLVAYGADNAECLRTCGIDGAFIRLLPAASLTASKGAVE